MNIKLIATSSALVLGLAFAAPAMAQTMIGSMSVSAEDLPKVQAQCDTLAAIPPASLGTDTTAEAKTENEVVPAEAAPNATAQATTTVDLTTITLDQCVEAGLAKKAP